MDMPAGDAASGGVRPITDDEFEQYRRFIYQQAGIDLSPQKRHLVSARLHKRLNHYGLRAYGDYYRLVTSPGSETERQVLIDLLTTNETYFFREPQHFDFLRQQILPAFRRAPFRAWSAACSSGEEVYTLAMVIADALGDSDWQIQGSDISQRMLSTAAQAVYPMERARNIPQPFLEKYCLKGVRSQAGFFQIDDALRRRTRFQSINLQQYRAPKPSFDLIFLRNVLIYFNTPTKRDVVARLAEALRPGGYLFVSHVESLHGIEGILQMVRPSIFRRPGSTRG
jgi:chemotaxis protein methyltransferase CheR